MRRILRTLAMLTWVTATAAFAVTLSPVARADEPTESRAEASSASSEDRERARELFMEGMDFWDETSFAEALERFRESYRLVPSPNSRLMTARTLRKLQRYREAWNEFEIVLEEAERAAAEDDKYAPTLESAKKEQAGLRAEVGLLTVHVDGEAPEDAVLVIAGRQTPRNEWGRVQAVAPGAVEVVLIAPSVEKVQETVELEAGGEEEVTLEVREVRAGAVAEGPSKDGSRDTLLTMAYVSGGVGVGGLALFGVVLATDGNSALGVTGLAMGAVGLGLGIALYAVAQDSEATGPRATLVAGPGSVSVIGSF